MCFIFHLVFLITYGFWLIFSCFCPGRKTLNDLKILKNIDHYLRFSEIIVTCFLVSEVCTFNLSPLSRGLAFPERSDAALHKNWSFPLRISLVYVTKSTVSRVFGHIYWRNLLWKTSFFAQYCHFEVISNPSEN